MAIQRKPSPNTTDNTTPPTELSLTINNGDFMALRDTTQRLGFKSEEDMLRFALAVLAQSATTSITIIDKKGIKISLNPSAELLEPNNPTT